MEHLSVDELKGILREVKKDWQKLMIVVAYNHGLRVSEVLSITPADIDCGYLTTARLKGSEKTIQKLVVHPDPDFDERDRVLALCADKRRDQRLFPMTRCGVYRLMTRIGLRLEIPKARRHPHSLKHSAAMSLIKTEGIEYVRKRLGHKSIASTGAYLKVSDRDADAAYERALVRGMA